MTEIPEPKDKLDTEVVVSGPEDDAERWRQVDWRRAQADVRRLRQRIFTASRRRFCPPISHQGLLEPDAGKLARPVCARHDQQLGGASPLWRLMAPTTSRWQPLSREAGWGGSRSAKSRP